MRSGYLWGALFVIGVMALVLHYEGRESGARERKAERLRVVQQLDVALVSAAEDEKSAVLAITDADSQRYADAARKATQLAEQRRAELEGLLQDPRERELLADFSLRFAALRKLDEQILDLAVRNTNLKAFALLFGPAADAEHELEAALRGEPAAVIAALHIEVLLAPHIAEQSDAKMDALEARIAAEERKVRSALRDADARIAYERLAAIQAQILRLSRENTNVRSLALSLNEKRAASAACQSALEKLEAAISQEPVAPLREPMRPR